MTSEVALVDAMLGTLPGTGRSSKDRSIERRFGPVPTEETLAEVITEMDRLDVELALLGSIPVNFEVYRPGPYTVGLGVTDELFDASCQQVAESIAMYPDRLRGFVYLDPSDCMTAVRRLHRAVTQYGITTAHVIPSVVGLAANHPTYFPLYAKCVELGATIRVHVGMPGPSHRAELQEPVRLDEVLLTFPELTLVGAHLGHPWIDQVIALLRKYENFYLMTSGWVPSRVPQAVWDFANTTRGADKVMWASDYPLLSISRTATEARAVPLKDDYRRRYLRDNAIHVHHLATPRRDAHE